MVAAGLAVLAAAGAVVAGVLIRRRRRPADPATQSEP
jgi:hypothetical protein